MKKLSLILLAFILVFAACKKEEEEDEEAKLVPSAAQRGFAVNYTATWCGPCGDWGAPLIHTYADGAPNGAIITSHASGDPMTNNLMASFSADRTTDGGVPSFWVGNTKTQSDGEMTTLMASGDAAAGVDYSFTISGNTMTIITKTKFFGSFVGDAYLSVLVLEDGIDGSSSAGNYKQNGTTNSYPNDDYHHDYVLRESSVSGNAYGEMISAAPASGSEVDKTYTITLDASWSNPYPIAIIWDYKSGDKPEYKYVNALKKK